MMKPETNAQTLDQILLQHYNIDVKLNDLFKSMTTSVNMASALLKGIFKPLQTHWVNATKITSVYGAATINMSSTKESIRVITEKLQFHDVVEQRLRHIRQINADIIKGFIALKKASETKPAEDAYVKLIAEINAAQLVAIASEYKSYCKKLDDNLNSIVKYLSDLTDFTKLLGHANNPDIVFLINQNSDLAERINLFISTFREDYSYRDAFSNCIEKIVDHFVNISSAIKTNEKASASHPKLKQLENLYTTQKEREIFSTLVNARSRQPFKLSNNSGIELF